MILSDILFPIYLNPFLISRLDGNVEASILLFWLKRLMKDKSDNDGWAFITRDELCELTGLSESKVQVSERFLKKRTILETKMRKGNRFYKIDSSILPELSGYRVRASLIKLLGNNAKAAFLLTYFLEFNERKKIPLFAEIPSKDIEFLTGLTENSQIFARDSLIGLNFLQRLDKKGNNYVLNPDELLKKGIISGIEINDHD